MVLNFFINDFAADFPILEIPKAVNTFVASFSLLFSIAFNKLSVLFTRPITFLSKRSCLLSFNV